MIAVKYLYNDTTIKQLFRIINPISLNKQGNDIGSQYRTGIYYSDIADKAKIQQLTVEEQTQYLRKIVTEVLPLKNFYLAEEYHQKYLKKNPEGYCHLSFDSLQGHEKNKDLQRLYLSVTNFISFTLVDTDIRIVNIGSKT